MKALGFHAGHDHAHDSETSGENEERDYLWKFLVASAAVYGFFLFETLTHLFFRKSIGHSHSIEVRIKSVVCGRSIVGMVADFMPLGDSLFIVLEVNFNFK